MIILGLGLGAWFGLRGLRKGLGLGLGLDLVASDNLRGLGTRVRL